MCIRRRVADGNNDVNVEENPATVMPKIYCLESDDVCPPALVRTDSRRRWRGAVCDVNKIDGCTTKLLRALDFEGLSKS